MLNWAAASNRMSPAAAGMVLAAVEEQATGQSNRGTWGVLAEASHGEPKQYISGP
jgi:hypothetical protein